MHLWSPLEDAVEDKLGGPDSADVRDWFVGSIVELFPDLSKTKAAQQRDGGPTEEPEQYDVEYRLVQVMDDEFELKLDDDDDSAYKLAEQIIRLRSACASGSFTEIEELGRRFTEREQQKKNNKRTRTVVVKEEDNETDWDSDDGEDDDDDVSEDAEMADAPDVAPPRKEKAVPEVDEDGFTKVARKKK
jgi:pre-rRNA-processing protein TSR2